MEVMRIAWNNSSHNCMSSGLDSPDDQPDRMVTNFCEPTRHGTHLPHDSLRKKRTEFKAMSSMQRLSAQTTIVPEAERILNGALKNDPNDTEAVFQRGIIALSRGDRMAALGAFNQTLSVYPDSGQVHYLLARVHRELGATASSQRELDQALRLNPDLLPARTELCARLLAVGSANGALQLLDAAPYSQRNTLPVIVQRNWALFAAGKTAEMRQGVDSALKRARTPELLVQAATLKFGKQEYGAAQRSLDRKRVV